MTLALILLTLILAALAAALVLASARWKAAGREGATRLQAAAAPDRPRVHARSELEGLPDPVRRYFLAVLPEGQPVPLGAVIRHQGEFLTRAPEGWTPFSSEQRVNARAAGFVWEARMPVAPGLAVLVRDASIGGQGSMRASLGGLVSLVRAEGSPALDQAALERHLAEAVWVPTSLLPSQGVAWSTVDRNRAKAVLECGPTRAEILFTFGPDGLIREFFAPARSRWVDGRNQPTPWQGRVSGYELRQGLRIPLQGEVEWLLPEGPLPYWRGRVTGIDYEWAASPKESS